MHDVILGWINIRVSGMGEEHMYRIIKVLNNNGILVLDGESQREVILLGNGIGFGHRTGERIESTGQAKRYELVTGRTSALQQVNSIEPVYIEAAGRIIEEAEGTMGTLSHDILIPMADHIALAVSRAREDRELPNPFRHDIKALFSSEYQSALKGVGIIRELTGITISEDEVGYITLHIHAGLSEENVAAAMDIARLVQDSMHQIESSMGVNLASDSLGYNRLASHVRYMIARARKGERASLDMQDYARTSFPKPYEVAKMVCRYMEKRLGIPLAPEETGFLAIHIQRVMEQ